MMKETLIGLGALAMAAAPLGASAQTKLSLAGSDSWEPVIDQAFLADPTLASGADLSTFLQYSGGGQTPGETALKNFTGTPSSNQVIAVFTGQLTDSGSGNLCGTYPNAQDIVVGVDGILNVGHPSAFTGVTGNPQLGNGTYTWQQVLGLLYTGRSSSSDTQDCNGAARRGLIADYSTLFNNAPAGLVGTPIRHIFRRGDASATAKLFLSLLSLPALSWCNGSDNDDLDPIRRLADTNDQIAEYDGTLGVELSILVPTFSNKLADLYTGSNGTSPATFGKFLGGQNPACATGPSPIDPSSASPGVAATAYTGILSGTLAATPRCDCRYPVPSHFADPTSANAKRFNWNIKLGIGCQAPQASAAPAWGVLNGDNGLRENTPAPWGTRVVTTVNGLPSAQRCCNVGSPATFQREDPRVVNLYLRDPATGAIKPSNTAPAIAYYRLGTTDQGLTNVDVPFNNRCTQTLASDLQVACLITGTPNGVDSIGFGALPVYKDTTSAGVTQPTPFNLNNDPIANTFSKIRDRSYGLSRYVFLSSLNGFGSLGESAAAHTGSSSTYAYTASPGASTDSTTYKQQLVDAQWNLAKALYTDSRRPDRANSAVEKYGFLALDPAIDPYAVACTGNANSTSATRIALDNATYFAK